MDELAAMYIMAAFFEEMMIFDTECGKISVICEYIKGELKMEYINSESSGIIYPNQGKNTIIPYEHQKDAMDALSDINNHESFSGLIVIPTGGGKTYTAATWLLKNAINKGIKVLWIAHRQFLLNQALEAFENYAYAEQMPNISSFSFRIISGSPKHDRMIDIKSSDDLIIASKDSIGKNIHALDKWINKEDVVYLVIDEAHHATAKTYRHIIDYLKDSIQSVKIIGLTATPYRTQDSEKGLLKKIFSDDIIYSISLKELINRQILSRLEIEEYQTGEDFGKNIGKKDWDSIVHMDTIPDNIAKQMYENKERNHLIVETYKKNKDRYGQTIVFTVSIAHATALTALFNKAGIKADYIVSSIKDMGTGVTLGQKDNEKKLEMFRDGKIQVLINVEILTEGVDLPQTKTVFLARPTVSMTLMTQMVGRALRGVKAGGTDVAYAVSFIDNWNIPFVSPDSLIEDESASFDDADSNRQNREIRLISISKIQEFAKILDDTVDTSAIEAIPFVQRIPIGMYSFTYLDKKGMDISYQIMVYNSNHKAYVKFMNMLPDIFHEYGNDDEYLPGKIVNGMEKKVYNCCFKRVKFPDYDAEDIKSVIEFYAQKESVPTFYSFDEIDKNKLDVSNAAKYIYDNDMGPRAQAEYLDKIWNENDDNILRLFFGRKLYFLKQVEIELGKLMHPDEFLTNSTVNYDKKAIENLPLSEIEEIDKNLADKLRNDAFTKAKDKNGYYCCAMCGKKGKTRRGFQVDYIVPLNKGGKSVPSNLQILCNKCNGKKDDK